MPFDLTNPFRTRPAGLAALPRIVRLYLLNAVIGFVLAGLFTAAILYLNVANIGHLVTSVSGGWLAALVFFVLNGIVFAGVQTAIVVMSIGDDEPPRGTRTPEPALQPVRVPAKRA